MRVGRERMNQDFIQAVTINNKVSNVCPGGGGVSDAEAVCLSIATKLNMSNSKLIVPCSTGVIGWKLPVKEMIANAGSLVTNLKKDNGVNLAESIMTTDLYPKLRSVTLKNGCRVVGVAKGAGIL